MRTYEHIFIVHPDTVGDDYAAVLEKFKGILAEQGASILKIDEWGSRKLAYPVKKQARGTYVLLVFEANPEVVSEFERRLRIDERIIKFQTILLPDGMETAGKSEGAVVRTEEADDVEEIEEGE
ncbi:MAG: 30S ribosomal protein S6 [Syntrophotaleaceae bacterium]